MFFRPTVAALWALLPCAWAGLQAQEAAPPRAPVPAARPRPNPPGDGPLSVFAPPDVYRLPFVVPGGAAEGALPKDEAHWIPKGIGLRFGGNHLLFDPETCAVRGWWRSGEEGLKRMNWGSRVCFIPGDAAQAQDAEVARFEWGPRDAYGVPPPARFAGYRWPQEGRVEIDWEAGEREGLLRVTETFLRSDAAWNGVALEGVARRIRAEFPRPGDGQAASAPAGAAVVGGRFRHAAGAPLWTRVDGQPRRLEAHQAAIAVAKEARLAPAPGGSAAALAFRVGEGATAELVVESPPEALGGTDIFWRVTPRDPAAREVEMDVAYYQLPEGATGESVVQGD